MVICSILNIDLLQHFVLITVHYLHNTGTNLQPMHYEIYATWRCHRIVTYVTACQKCDIEQQVDSQILSLLVYYCIYSIHLPGRNSQSWLVLNFWTVASVALLWTDKVLEEDWEILFTILDQSLLKLCTQCNDFSSGKLILFIFVVILLIRVISIISFPAISWCTVGSEDIRAGRN